jgi:hypothetical protein
MKCRWKVSSPDLLNNQGNLLCLGERSIARDNLKNVSAGRGRLRIRGG